MDMNTVRNGIESQFIGFADGLTRFYSAASQPHGEGINVMVSAGSIPIFAHGRATEFSPPNDKGILEQPASLEIFHQRRLALVNFTTNLFKVALKILSRTAMAVPVGMIELHEANTSFHQPSGQEAIVGERRFVLFDAVKLERGIAFTGKVDQVRRARLHYCCTIVRRDPGCDFRVSRLDQVL